jgi:hypothetical protein
MFRWRRMLALAEGGYDRVERFWAVARTQRRVGSLLTAAFVLALLTIEAGRRGWLPAGLAGRVPDNHFYAVDLAFTLLLLFEVITLVLTLAQSVSLAVGKQFEILSLILVRHTFKEFTAFPEPVTWEAVRPALPDMAAVAAGALSIFVGLGFFYRQQRHLPLSADPDERWSFVASKKLVSLGLLLLLIAIGAGDALRLLRGEETYPFFETFYTVLIFSDVLLVLLALRYSSTYAIVFRNSAFAVSTVFLRLALTSPPLVKAGLGVGALLLALAVTVAYHRFAPVLPDDSVGKAGG